MSICNIALSSIRVYSIFLLYLKKIVKSGIIIICNKENPICKGELIMMNYNNLERKRLKRRKVISRLLGILLILLGLFAGIYFGIYQCFILAIVDVIDGVKSNFDAMQIAIGIAKLLIGSSFSEFIAIILIYWGIIVIE